MQRALSPRIPEESLAELRLPRTRAASPPARARHAYVDGARRFVQPLAFAAGWAMTAPMLLAVAARLLAHDRAIYLVWVNAYTFWVYMPAYPVALGALLFRRWSLAIATFAVIFFHLAWVLPDYRGAAPIPPGAHTAPRLKLFSTNLWYGNPDPTNIFREALDSGADIIFVQEFTPEAEQLLIASGIDAVFPHHIGESRPGAQGTAVYSRLPLSEAEVFDVGGVPMTRATVEVGGHPVRLYNVHPVSPSGPNSLKYWNAEVEALLAAVRAEPGEVIVAGDFNMTQHHAWYGRFTKTLTDSFRVRGKGNAATWPNGLRKLRPIRIDHVFHSDGVVALEIATGRGEGSDHRPVIATLALYRPD